MGSAQKCQKVPRVPKSAQKCPECPKVPRVPKSAQSAQKCPKKPRVPRMPKNVKKWPEHPKMPRKCPELPNLKKFYLKLFWDTLYYITSTSYQHCSALRSF